MRGSRGQSKTKRFRSLGPRKPIQVNLTRHANECLDARPVRTTLATRRASFSFSPLPFCSPKKTRSRPGQTLAISTEVVVSVTLTSSAPRRTRTYNPLIKSQKHKSRKPIDKIGGYGCCGLTRTTLATKTFRWRSGGSAGGCGAASASRCILAPHDPSLPRPLGRRRRDRSPSYLPRYGARSGSG